MPVTDIKIKRYEETANGKVSKGFSGHRRLMRAGAKGNPALLVNFEIDTTDEQVEVEMFKKLSNDAFEEVCRGMFTLITKCWDLPLKTRNTNIRDCSLKPKRKVSMLHGFLLTKRA